MSKRRLTKRAHRVNISRNARDYLKGRLWTIIGNLQSDHVCDVEEELRDLDNTINLSKVFSKLIKHP